MLAVLDGDVPGSGPPKVRGFATILALVLATEAWCRALALGDGYDVVSWATLAAATGFAAASFVPGWRRLAFAGLCANQLLAVAHDFPGAGNHAYLEVVLCALVAFLDADDEEQCRIFLRAVRWIVCVVLLASGFQKLAWGYWLDGQQLAYSLWIPSFRPVLAKLLPADEFARVAAYAGQVGDGPYAIADPGFAMISNGIYLAEIALAGLLLWPRTRALAVGAALGLLVAIEIGAREVFFGLNFANALVLFLPAEVRRPAIGVAATACALLLLSRLSVIPSAVFY